MDAEKRRQLQTLAERIGRLRRGQDMTLEKLAYEVGISKGNLSDIENAKRDPRFTTLQAIAEGLGVSISQLLKSL